MPFPILTAGFPQYSQAACFLPCSRGGQFPYYVRSTLNKKGAGSCPALGLPPQPTGVRAPEVIAQLPALEWAVIEVIDWECDAYELCRHEREFCQPEPPLGWKGSSSLSCSMICGRTV